MLYSKLNKAIIFTLATIIFMTYTYHQQDITYTVSSPVVDEVSLPIPKFRKEFDAVVSLLPLNILHSATTHTIKELHCMALNNYYEASIEGVDGMRAVSQVVLNRTESRGFPNTACAVIRQEANGVCQFSWNCQKTLPRLDTNSAAWKNAVYAAHEVYIRKDTITGLEDALFYHATSVSPKWNKLVKVKKIGSHIFYKKKETI